MYKDEIKKWAANGTDLGSIRWDELPDIPLYMDQVIGFLGEKLSFYETNTKLLTNSMINNYVKSEVIPHPNKKKYSKEHLGQLVMICMLKHILSIADIKTLLEGSNGSREFYESFQETQTNAMNEVSAQVRFSLENGDDPKLTALKFAAEANAKRAAAERILYEIRKDSKPEKSEKNSKKSK